MFTPPLPTTTTGFTPPLLIVSNQLYLLNMKTGLLQGRLGRSHCMQRSWLASDKRPQLPNERQLHHCLHVTDGWQCWQTGGINWRGYQGRARLHFRASLFFLFTLVLSASRCIFIQMQGEDESERPLAECTCFFKVILMQSICAYPLCVCTQKIVLYILLGCGVGQNRYAQRKWHELK